jgi:4a-hydroxytetrahydrobiopterin dehydratase
MEQPWIHRQRPERLERRVEFDDYESTRLFLEKLNDLSEREQRYPDISFGRTYVNLTLRAEQDDQPISEVEHSFAMAIDALVL